MLPIKRISYILCAVVLIFSCKPEKSADTTANKPVQADPVQQVTNALPDPCTFLDESIVSSLVDIPAENVSIKRGGNSSTVPAKSCFYKWTGGEVGNAGLMIQALGNPIPDEFPNWAFFFIDNKKAQGEISMEEPDVKNKYTTIDIAEQACYNHKLAKCYFRQGDTVYLIALNGISDNDKKITIYRSVAEKILSRS